MDDQERKTRLNAMRQALKEGRTQRKNDMGQLEEALYEEIYELHHDGQQTSYGLDKVMNMASNRKMLHEVRAENRYGEQSRPIMAIKENEPYEKRPSVRALKKSRQTGGRSM